MSFENFVQCQVVTPILASAVDFSLKDAVAPYRLPAAGGGYLVLADSPVKPSKIEVVKYTSRSALGIYEVQRGQEGTTAQEWTGQVYCYQSLMAGEFQSLLDSKVDKATGQSLMLDAERTKLAGIAEGAQVNTVTSVAGKTGAVTLGKADVNLGDVDNTSDANKPISAATQIALDAKAPLASPALTGNPTAPTPAATDNNTSIATTKFVRAAMGLFGLGTASNLVAITADVDTLTDSGTYWLNSASTNKPLAQSGQLVVVAAPNPNTNSQFFYAHMGSTTPRLFFRHKNSGTGLWNPWQELWHTGNILGTVSQSGGVPTGAIIERGSNANGEYVRFADGTQLCTRSFTGSLSVGGVTGLTGLYKGQLRWDFPATFYNTSTLSLSGCGADNAQNGWVGGGTSVSTSYVDMQYFTPNSDVTSTAIRFMAIGRWY